MKKIYVKTTIYLLVAVLSVGKLSAQDAQNVERTAKFQVLEELKQKAISSSQQLSSSQSLPVATPAKGNIFENVESHTDFTINSTLNGWSYIDGDAGRTWGIGDVSGNGSVSFQNSESQMAYIVFNPSMTSPSLASDPSWAPRSGSKYFACFSAAPVGEMQTPIQTNDWLISPELTNPAKLSFWARSATDMYGLERMRVGYSTTGKAEGDFASLTAGSYISVPITWTNYEYDLPVGTKYIAINCVSYNAFVFMVDDISIEQSSSVAEVSIPEIQIYPNPSTGLVNIKTDGNSTVQISDVAGKIIGTHKIDANSTLILNQPVGLYFIKVESNGKTSTHKLVISE